MLNRRVLRIKVMQALYALERCKASDLELAKDQIKDFFTPNLNSDIIPDRTKLKEQEKLTLQIFAKNYANDQVSFDQDIDEDIKKAVSQAIAYYNNKVKEDTKHIEQNMLAETEHMHAMYLLLLQLLVVFADESLEDIKKRKNSQLQSSRTIFDGEYNFSKNSIIQIIRDHEELQQELIRKGLSWEEDMIDVKSWFKEILKKDEQYVAYSNKSKPTFEDDFELIDHIIKTVFFKNEIVNEFLEQKDLYWVENKKAVRSMLRKTIKSIKNSGSQMELTRLSADWEEDREFFKELFQLTVQGDVEYDGLIARFAKNWDNERIAAVDFIILKLALCEMINFMGIPTKVTINEYIDISKNYGSLKSKQFINGILDKASHVLSEEGKIRKSGRGLIDNK